LAFCCGERAAIDQHALQDAARLCGLSGKVQRNGSINAVTC
jgi:hypothetical protein